MHRKRYRIGIAMIALTGLSLLAGCSGEDRKAAAYRWQPPMEHVSWGQSKEEVLAALDLSEEDTENLGELVDTTAEMLILKEPLSFLGKDVQAMLAFDPEAGLVRVGYSFVEDGALEEVLPELLEEYSSEQGTENSIYGSVPQDMDAESVQKYKEYVEQEGMAKDEVEEYCSLPLVVVTYDTDSSSPMYNSCNFSGSRAALWEHAQ